MDWLRPLSPAIKLRRTTGALLSLAMLGSLFTHLAPGQAKATQPTPPQSARRTQYSPSHFPKRATMYYHGVWGIDSPTVRSTESGELIRFSFYVLDADRARQLNDKKAEPVLIDPRARVKLVVPSLEKVGQLRQSSTPEIGKEYWMAFSNPHKTVKRGDRVIVVIGNFHADGLLVE
jgi:DNA-directed RNA polymerase subunit K/omega